MPVHHVNRGDEVVIETKSLYIVDVGFPETNSTYVDNVYWKYDGPVIRRDDLLVQLAEKRSSVEAALRDDFDFYHGGSHYKVVLEVNRSVQTKKDIMNAIVAAGPNATILITKKTD